MNDQRLTLPGALARGAIAGLAGTAVMTAFQKLIEMPLTGRADSYAPAKFGEKVLRLRPTTERGRWWLNYAMHFSVGIGWGVAFGLAGRAGLRGRRALAAIFSTVYPSDVLLNTAIGLYAPRKWSRQDVVVDVVDKLVQAAATSAVFDRLQARA